MPTHPPAKKNGGAVTICVTSIEADVLFARTISFDTFWPTGTLPKSIFAGWMVSFAARPKPFGWAAGDTLPALSATVSIARRGPGPPTWAPKFRVPGVGAKVAARAPGALASAIVAKSARRLKA
jgi:hypothetical protein